MLACLPVVVFEPVWFVRCTAGLHVVFGLIRGLFVLVYLVSLVFEPFGLVSLLLVLAFVFPLSILVYLVLALFELSKLVLFAFSLVFGLTEFVSVFLWCVLAVSVVIRFRVGWVWVVVDGLGVIGVWISVVGVRLYVLVVGVVVVAVVIVTVVGILV